MIHYTNSNYFINTISQILQEANINFTITSQEEINTSTIQITQEYIINNQTGEVLIIFDETWGWEDLLEYIPSIHQYPYSQD